MCWYISGYVRKKALLQCLCNHREEGYGLIRGALVYVLLCFGMGNMLANFHTCGIMLVLRAVCNMLASPRGSICFR